MCKYTSNVLAAHKGCKKSYAAKMPQCYVILKVKKAFGNTDCYGNLGTYIHALFSYSVTIIIKKKIIIDSHIYIFLLQYFTIIKKTKWSSQ